MKHRIGVMILLVGTAACIGADEPAGVRNPFWPDGYEGVREVISPEARVVKDAKTLEAEATAKKAEEERLAAEEARRAAELALEKARSVVAPMQPQAPATSQDDAWVRARRLLRIGNPASVTDAAGHVRASVSINGEIYVENDQVSITQDGIRYIWRLRRVEGSKSITLVRVRAISESEIKKKGKRK